MIPFRAVRLLLLEPLWALRVAKVILIIGIPFRTPLSIRHRVRHHTIGISIFLITPALSILQHHRQITFLNRLLIKLFVKIEINHQVIEILLQLDIAHGCQQIWDFFIIQKTQEFSRVCVGSPVVGAFKESLIGHSHDTAEGFLVEGLDFFGLVEGVGT